MPTGFELALIEGRERTEPNGSGDQDEARPILERGGPAAGDVEETHPAPGRAGQPLRRSEEEPK